jgi:HJR/Mrr/RecB family endonuclease
MNFICPNCKAEGSVADNLVPEYGCWYKCKSCNESILLKKESSLALSNGHEQGQGNCLNNDQTLIGIRLIGKLKLKGTYCILIDEKSTRYEIFHFDFSHLSSSYYSPEFREVRIKKKDAPAETDREHYFIFDKDLYFSEEVIDQKRRDILSNKFNNFTCKHLHQDPQVDIIPPSMQNFATIRNVADMSGIEFEILIKELLESMDFEVQETKQTGDGGIDLIAYNNDLISGGTYIVQCKRWSNSIGESYIRDLYGVVTACRANKGILITNSTFSKSAIKFAENLPIGLIDGDKLSILLEERGLDKTNKTNKFNKFSEYAKALSGTP